MNFKIPNWFRNPFVLFLIAWGIMNIVQARLTPLDNDEAYYWMYSKYLAWGYFDHPPMIALMIKIGYSFFHNELGVRIITVLSQLVTLSLIWFLTDKEKQMEKENILFFIMLVVSLPICNIFGFVATPDAPLIFFSTIFLLSYKRFLEKDSWQNTFFIGISMAALMYSKYHSGLLIILIILSNLRLLKNFRFYVASFLALILLFPHIFWQYSSGFPSLKYHLIDRVSSFNPSHVYQYLISQFFFQNPFILCILIWIMIKVRAKNLFDRALYFIAIGFFSFFFISSFRYSVEPQWDELISVPMIILVVNNLDFKPWIRSYIKWIAILVFPLILFVRLAYAIDFLPVPLLKKEYHDKKQWAKDISVLAGNRPVVFTNSYQHPSVYTFYTGKFAYELNSRTYRKTQYDIWNFEEQVHGKEVLYVPHFLTDNIRQNFPKQVLSTGDTTYYKIYKDFQSLQKECVILENSQFVFSRSVINSIHLKIFNPYPYPINLIHEDLAVVFQIGFLKNGKMEVKKNLDLPAIISQINVRDTISVDCQFTLEDLPAGVYKFGICSETGALYDVFNSKFREARIID
jgi:hypothetical protein